MAWLGEEIEEKSEEALAPRCVKDVIEERLFAQRRDLFADLSAVFMHGDVADVATLLPVIDRLRHRFSIGRVCVVADRGIFAKGAVQQNEFRRSRRDPYQKVTGWLLPRLDRS